jgi:hypothetical protein
MKRRSSKKVISFPKDEYKVWQCFLLAPTIVLVPCLVIGLITKQPLVVGVGLGIDAFMWIIYLAIFKFYRAKITTKILDQDLFDAEKEIDKEFKVEIKSIDDMFDDLEEKAITKMMYI